MKIRGTVASVILSVMLLTVAGWVVAVGDSDKTTKPAKAVEKPKEISNTKSASCILRISYDPSVLPLNRDMVDLMIRSSGVLGKVTKEILGHYDMPPVILEEIGNPGDMIPMGEMGGGMMGGMGMGGGMMGMGGFEGGGGMSMPITPPDVPDAPSAPEAPKAPTAPSANSAPAKNEVREPTERELENAFTVYADKQFQERTQHAQQRAREAERQAMEAQRRAEQLQARIGRSTRYGRQELVDLMPGTGAGTTRDLLLHFEINLDGYVSAANEAMEATINLLSNALQRDFDLYKERMTKRADLVQKQAEEAEQLVRKLQANLQELSPSKELRRESLMEEISSCRDQIRRNQLEDELNRALADNLNQQMEEAKKKADIQMAGDPVLKDLETMLVISKERVDAAKQLVAAGQANQNSLQDAMEKLTRANIELSQRREQIGISAGAERINDQLKRMSDISLQMTKYRIQLERLSVRIAEAEKQLDKSVDYELLSMRLELAKEKLRESLRRAESIRDYQPQPPLVTPIGTD